MKKPKHRLSEDDSIQLFELQIDHDNKNCPFKLAYDWLAKRKIIKLKPGDIIITVVNNEKTN